MKSRVWVVVQAPNSNGLRCERKQDLRDEDASATAGASAIAQSRPVSRQRSVSVGIAPVGQSTGTA